MFQLVQEVWPFLAAFYLLDAFVYLHSGHVLLLARAGKTFDVFGPGLHWLGPWLGARAYLAPRLQPGLTASGLFLPRSADVDPGEGPEVFDFLPYEQIEDLAVEHTTLRASRRYALRCPSRAHAEDLAALLRELRSQNERQRAGTLAKRNRAAFDLEAARAMARQLEELARPLIWLCSGLWLVVFLGLPAVAFSSNNRRLMAALLLSAAIGHLAIVVVSHVVLGRSRRLGIPPPRGTLTPLYLSPPAALRAPAHLWRDAFRRFDSLTVAATLLPPTVLAGYARRELFVSEQALAFAGDEPWRGWWQQRRQLIVAVLAELQLEVDEIATAPTADQDLAAAAFCPLCEGEYRAGFEVCSDCAVPLLHRSS